MKQNSGQWNWKYTQVPSASIPSVVLVGHKENNQSIFSVRAGVASAEFPLTLLKELHAIACDL